MDSHLCSNVAGRLVGVPDEFFLGASFGGYCWDQA
jgi:hypothetical protein